MKKLNELSTLADAIKTERRLLGMTQKEAALQFKISLKALRNLEQGYGSVTLATASTILEYMGKQFRIGDIVTIPPARGPQKRPRRDQILETLTLVKPVLERKFNVDKIALFGSCARDEAPGKSDIDIAVNFSKPPTFSSLGRLNIFLESLLDGRKVDLVEFQKMVPAIAAKARRDFKYV